MSFLRRPALAVLVCAAALAPLAVFAKSKKADATPEHPHDVGSTYKGYIVIDAATGRTLAEDHADEVSPPASMTKLMTFAVLYDRLAAGQIALTTPVTVNREEARFAMKPDSTSVWLKEGETYPVEELIYAMMIQSANDAALALARVAGGSPAAFVGMMNTKARELGMTHTTFRTPHGFARGKVDPSVSDLTTPRDFAVLCRHLVLHTDVLKYTSVRQRFFGAGQRTQLVDMHNHDHLLAYAPGVDGLKTGYTEGAGYCLSTTVQRNGHRLVGVIMGAFGRPGHEKDKGFSRDHKMTDLIDHAFATLPAGTPTFAAAPDATPVPSPISSAPPPADDKNAPGSSDATVKFAAPTPHK